jgi:hypothetical protein
MREVPIGAKHGPAHWTEGEQYLRATAYLHTSGQARVERGGANGIAGLGPVDIKAARTVSEALAKHTPIRLVERHNRAAMPSTVGLENDQGHRQTGDLRALRVNERQAKQLSR